MEASLNLKTEPKITWCCGYEFKNGSYLASAQYARYKAALDGIQKLAVRLQKT